MGRFFDFVGNANSFKMTTIMQIKKLISSTNNEKDLMSFAHSIQAYNFESSNPNMIICKCCKEQISKDSITCVHCGQPVPENERKADIFMKILCFVLPPVGIIIFLLNIGPFPKFSKIKSSFLKGTFIFNMLNFPLLFLTLKA